MKTISKSLVIVALPIVLSACASNNQTANKVDPLESVNRPIYQFNEKVDNYVYKPVTKVYTTVVPTPVRTCVGNIFSNFGNIVSGANSLLQGRALDTINSMGRFMFNATLGLGGCIDVATMKGAQKIDNDFGTTLAVWGVGQGPYVMLPFAGPSTFKDLGGMITDSTIGSGTNSSVGAIDNVPLRNSLYGLSFVDTRSKLTGLTSLVDEIALDKYAFIRDAYLQKRQSLLNQKLAPNPYVDEKNLKAKALWAKWLGDGSSSGAAIPQYDDPEASGANSANGKANANVPQYDDPEASSNSASSPAAKVIAPSVPAKAPQSTVDPSVPQYDDPGN